MQIKTLLDTLGPLIGAAESCLVRLLVRVSDRGRWSLSAAQRGARNGRSLI